MSAWTVILTIAAGTYLMRASFLVLVEPERVPKQVRRALPFAPAAVLGALVVATLSGGREPQGMDPSRVVALLLAGTVAWYTESVFATLLAGMASLFALNALMGVLP